MNETRQTQFSPRHGPRPPEIVSRETYPPGCFSDLHFCLDTAHRSMVCKGYADHLPPEVNCSCLKRPDKHPQGLLPFPSIGQFDRQQPGKQTQCFSVAGLPGSCLLCLLFLPQAAHFCLRGPSISTRPLFLPRPFHLSFLFSPKPLFSPPRSLTSHHPSISLCQRSAINISFHFSSFFLSQTTYPLTDLLTHGLHTGETLPSFQVAWPSARLRTSRSRWCCCFSDVSSNILRGV